MVRAVVFRLHLSVAVAAGLVILMMAVTGVILSLRETVTGLTERRHFVDATFGAPRLAPEEIAAAVGFEATSMQYRAHPRSPVRVYEGRDRYARVDPYTGDVLGHGPGALEGFFEGVHDWHRWFNVSDVSVRRARAVTGAVNVAFVFLLVTGPLLWIPRRLTRRALAGALLIQPGAKGAWRDLSWHQVVGFWSAVPLLAIAATGITTSYPGVGDRVNPVVGAVVPVGVWPGGVGVEAVAAPATEEDALDARSAEAPVGGTVAVGDGAGALGAVLATAEGWVPEWRTLVLTLPRTGAREVRVEVRGGRAGQPQRIGHLTVDAATGDIREWRSFADDSPGRRAQQFLRYAHTGEYWGLAGQLLAGLFSLAATVMVWTGLSLALRRARRFVRGWRSQRG